MLTAIVLKELTTTDAASDANYNFTIDTKGNGYTNGSTTTLIFKNNMEVINDRCFSGCKNIERIVFPKKSQGHRAFCICSLYKTKMCGFSQKS